MDAILALSSRMKAGTLGRTVAWLMDNASNRVTGTFTTPDSPTADPDGNPTSATAWYVAGPR